MISIRALRIAISGHFVLALGIVVAPSVRGQEQYRYFAPTKDVAMLVDVSRSVKADESGHEDARDIIAGLVGGKPFNKDEWTVEPGDPEMAKLFARYLGLPTAPDAPPAELRPLISVQNSFLTLPVGRLTTVLNGEVHRKLRDVQGIGDLINSAYPKSKDMQDGSTCYWFAMAQAAETLSQKSRLGYYLFVVSDEEDDPDYRPDGPPGHSKVDYQRYREEMEPSFPVEAIRSVIKKYFTQSASVNNAERYKTRGEFQQVLIARFRRPGGQSRNKVIVSWYGMGVAPERVQLPVAPARVVPQAAPAVVYRPPALTPRLEMLGGLETGRKSFDYQSPIIVWQIANLESGGWDMGGSRSSVILAAARTKQGELMRRSLRQGIKSWQLPASFPDGSQMLEVRVEDRGKSDDADQALVRNIEVMKTGDSSIWLTALVIASALAAVIIFIVAWRSLRQTRVIAPA